MGLYQILHLMLETISVLITLLSFIRSFKKR